ncbi:MAG: hypothetical protein OXE82_14390 [Rhodobacter sp.]|nr:hypothetical protein [Rhodobacter sp.]
MFGLPSMAIGDFGFGRPQAAFRQFEAYPPLVVNSDAWPLSTPTPERLQTTAGAGQVDWMRRKASGQSSLREALPANPEKART